MRGPARGALLAAALAALGLLGVGCEAPPAPEPAPPPAPPPPPPALSDALAVPGGALVSWNSAAPCTATALGAERRVGGAWRETRPAPAFDALGPAAVYVPGLDPGAWRFTLELGEEEGGRRFELGPTAAIEVPDVPSRWRFLDLREDLGQETPLGLAALLAFPWEVREPGVPPLDAEEELRRALEDLSLRALRLALGPTYSVGRGELTAFESARESLLEGVEAGVDPILPGALSASVLCAVDLRLPRGGAGEALLGLRVFDLSYRRYQQDKPVRRLWNTRLLVFEDFVALDAGRLAGEERLAELLRGLRLLVGEASADPVLLRLRDFHRRLGGTALSDPARQLELLEILGAEVAAGADRRNFRRVERAHLFPRAGDAPFLALPTAGGPAAEPDETVTPSPASGEGEPADGT